MLITRSAGRRFGATELLVTIVILVVLAALLAPALMKTRCGGARTKCSGNLRQVALAALQYGDDKRFLPHYGKTAELDGDVDSGDTPRAVRALVWYGYHDNPEGFVCPNSVDVYVPITDAKIRDNMRLWAWEDGSKGAGNNTVSPWRDGLPDPSLRRTDELSYAYTRRAYNSNVASTKVLGADRALRVKDPRGLPPGDVGNHVEGWNVTLADATVDFFPLGGERSARQVLLGTGNKDAALPMGGSLPR